MRSASVVERYPNHQTECHRQRRCGQCRYGRAALTALTRSRAVIAGAVALMTAGPGSPGQSEAHEIEERQRFGAWEVACLTDIRCIAASLTPRIQAYYGWILNDRSPRLVFRTPPGAEVGDPLTVRLDSGWSADMRLLECSPELCQTMVEQDQTDWVLQEMRQANTATLAYLFADRIIIAELSLDGLGDAVDHMARQR